MTLEQNITAILESYFSGFKGELIEACVQRIMKQIERQADTPQTETKGVGYCNECKWFRNKQVCGRCRSRNLFCEAEPQPRCPNCGKRGYIRSLESMGVKLKVFDEYKWKCTNCNKYFKEEPKDEPQTERSE